MSGTASRRVDPRALLNAARAARGVGSRRAWGRTSVIALLALTGLGAFGAVVVRANDDAGVLAFIKQQSRPAPVRQAEAAPSGTRSFFPSLWGGGARRDSRSAPAGERRAQQRIVASYAPATGLGAPARPSVVPHTARRYHPTATPARTAEVGTSPLRRGSSVAYCVRTCDGYFFPLGPSSGSDAGDAAACDNLCPATETRVYMRRVGDEMDEARALLDGRRYAALPAAFDHRNAAKSACSCTGAGSGLATTVPSYLDKTLRVGDIVVTSKGMKVFDGGRLPYRDANFTPFGRSRLIDTGTRESLRQLEQASLPGRSGLPHKPLASKTAPTTITPPTAWSGQEDATASFRVVSPMTQLR